MALIDVLAEEFDPSVRARGQNYFERGAVDVMRVTHRSVTAAVQAEKRHVVEIDWDGGFIAYECTCEDFHYRGQPCKHIWAAVLEADDMNRLPDEDELDEMAGRDGGGAEDDAGGGGGDNKADRSTVRSARPSKPAVWKRRLSDLKSEMSYRRSADPEPWPAGREVVYVIDRAATLEGRGLQVDLATRARRKDGLWERPKNLKRLTRGQISLIPDIQDRQILQMLAGAERADYGAGAWDDMEVPRRYRLAESAFGTVLKAMCDTARCRLRRQQGDNDPTPLAWDDGGPWEFVIGLKKEPGGFSRVDGRLRRGEARMEIREPDLVVRGGLVFAQGKVAALDDGGAFELIALLRRDEKLAAPVGQERELLTELFNLPRLPQIELPADFQLEQVRVAPKLLLKLKPPGKNQYPNPDALRGELSFDYAGQMIAVDQSGSVIMLKDENKLIHRDSAVEKAAWNRLLGMGFRPTYDYHSNGTVLHIAPKALPPAVRALAAEGWHVEAEGKLYRSPGEMKIEVSSGIDWFEVHGSADFDGQSVALPELLAALRKGETTVRLGDGTFGVLPEDWLQKYGLLAGVGVDEGDHLRFKKSQAGLLDALLAAQSMVTVDATFAAAREALRNFEGVRSEEPPAGFVGVLRPYQKEGLGWLTFLRQFGFGGCLADDMGLGKTVQILALLEARRAMRDPVQSGNTPAADAAPGPGSLTSATVGNPPSGNESAAGSASGNGDGHAASLITLPPGPSLVVVPRSLVFNWKQEAEKFAPKLRVLDHTGAFRDKSADRFGAFDLVVTTYGTLRNDAAYLKDVKFDYVILDEAQSVKNAASESAKAVRLLNGDHRLALSGTPVQNHLGELWSLFEFLNPGMLGASSAFSAAGPARNLDEESRQALSRALRPFILRRTKGQVAKDLPERLEQTIYCDLDATQRKLYDELRDHYRQALVAKIAADGMNKSKIMILEALLRLRQAACHPGLIDKSRVKEGSAKLDTLVSRLTEIHEEGHKAIVFSQFTSLLSIVKHRLDADKVTYEYLDGKTRDRDARVKRFQTDDDCKLFLVSLKAGGVGLNLTAAEYVFLLDPWWNPAVEAQAIDRAHRIGQTRRVFAYRLIARDTVEQKVLDLQKTKRDLADAVISADNRTIATLAKEDLELLLS